MNLFNRSAALAAGSVALALTAVPASAQDLPPTGEFEIFYVLVETDPKPAITIGEGTTVTAYRYAAHALSADGTGLFHNMFGNCTNYITVHLAAGTLEYAGHCDYQNAAGDHLYEEFHTVGETPIAMPEVVGTWLGGTGIFAGITGEFEIRAFPGIVNGAVRQAGGLKVGSYRIE